MSDRINDHLLTQQQSLISDFRLLEAVDIPELHHLKDVIVFPTRGVRPHALEIGGGDLDGDLYFVTWDLVLTQIKPVEPMDYKSLSSTTTRKEQIPNDEK